MAFENFKIKFDQWSVKKRFDDKQERKIQKKARAKAALDNALQHPEDQKQYQRALHQFARQQTGQNLIAFGKWIIKDLIWLGLPYLPYSQFQLTLITIANYPELNSKILWITQQHLLLYAIITGVVTLVALQGVIRQGWFHRPHKKGDLRQYVHQLQAQPHHPAKLNSKQQQHRNNKAKHNK